MPAFLMMEFARMVLLIALVVTGSAHAHLGHDSRVEVRVFQDRMRLVYRTSLPVAWNVLGERAPAMANEAGKAVAEPLLADAAPKLFSVVQGGVVMVPVKAEGIFEPDEHVAFVLNFARPESWPVTIEMKWFPPGGQLDATTVVVFDLRASPFARDLKPFFHREIRSDRPTVTFDLDVTGDAPVSAAEPRPDPVLAEGPVAAPPRGRSWAWLAGSAVVSLLLLGGWKWLTRKR